MNVVARNGLKPGELVERVRALHPLIKKHAAGGEADRRVADDVIFTMTKAGLFKLCNSRRYGGYETSTRDMLDVMAAIAEADGGTAWVSNIYNGIQWICGLFPQAAQDDIFGADPEARVAGVLTPSAEARRVDGGIRVSGKWNYCSGVPHASWVLVGTPEIAENGEKVLDQSLVLIPASDYTVEDTWFVTGMKSTGSNTVVANDVFVPSHRILSVPAAIEGKPATEHLASEPLFRSAFIAFLSVILVGPQLGLGRAALQYVRERAAKKSITYTVFEKQSSSVAFQLQIADAAMAIDTAHLHAYRAADDIDMAALKGEYPDMLTRIRCRADTGLAAEKITAAIDRLLWASGSGAFAEASVLQRYWRDSSIAARHGVVLPAIGYELYGKALLGVDEFITPLV